MVEAYFDNAATTMPYPEIYETLQKYMMNEYANPSSLHKKGFSAAKAIEYTNKQILKAFKLHDRRVIYTSGATESANLAIKGTMEKYADYTKSKIVTTTIEHPCVSEVFSYYQTKGVDTAYIGVDGYGKINENQLYNEITPNTKIVSIIWVNNEFGALQNLSSIMKNIKKINKNTLIHIDAVQGFGKVNDDLSDADMITISAHKFHGPKGIGALIIKKSVTLFPQMLGGGQQDGFRSGTINAPSIAAMGKSCEIMMKNQAYQKIATIQKYLYDRLFALYGGQILNTKIYENSYGPHILNLSFEGLKGEVLLHMLEENNIYVSTSSACSTHRKDHPSVLSQIGLNKKQIEGTIRISISEFNTREQADHLIDKLSEAVNKLRLLKGNR